MTLNSWYSYFVAGALTIAVAIGTISDITSSTNPPTWDYDKSTVQVLLTQGWGSGVAIGDGTLIMTAAHVAEGAVKGKVRVVDVTGRIQEATVVWVSGDVDIAILKVEEAIEPANVQCDPIKKGEKVRVVGFPGPGTEIHWAHTEGIVVKAYDDGGLPGFPGPIIVTDATIYAGNSGGPMFNEDKEVVGIVVAGFVGWDVYGRPIMHGYNLAIPMSYICEIIPGDF